MYRAWLSIVVLASIGLALPVAGDTPAQETPAQRGRRILETKAVIPAIWSRGAYDQIWTRWEQVREKPKDYEAAVREIYGLHPAPYPNNGLPMGLRNGQRLFQPGLAVDCMACHGSSIMGQSYIGLGNASLDVHALFEDLALVDRLPGQGLPFHFSNVRGTSEAGTMSVYLLGRRNPDLTVRGSSINLGMHDDQCEDVPAWWLIKKKKTIYFTGATDARSVRSLMQFMMGSILGPEAFARIEPDFVDIQQYLKSIEAPKYPLPIDRTLASQGEKIFLDNCARCHGTYGESWTYPNKIIPLAEIGTDPKRYEGITHKFGEYYDQSWFAQSEAKSGQAYKSIESDGYQAPPLDGIWATAPYLHNGSCPTVYHVLNSNARPKQFTRSYKTSAEDYDPVRLGWKTIASGPADRRLPAREQRKVYDTTQPGRSNAGHTYGDKLSEPERMAVIEYLKTL